jgi:hypothetical protein
LTLAGCDPRTGAGGDGTAGEGIPTSADQTAPPAAAPGGTANGPSGNGPSAGVLAASAPAQVELGRDPVTVAVPLSPEANQRLLALAGEPGRVRLIIEGLTQLRPGVHYQVYLNLPAGAEAQPGGPQFLGHVAVVAAPGSPGEGSRSFDIAGVVGALRRQGLWTEDGVRVTFVPAPPREELDAAPGSGPFFRLRRITIVER